MAITHNDLSLRARNADVGSRIVLSLVVLSIICGLLSFVLCLAAEASRSEVTWYVLGNQGDNGKTYQCIYSSSGRTALACSVAAFLLLAVAMFAEHAYMLVAVTSPKPPALTALTLPDDPRALASTKALTWQVCCLFLTTWICFAIAEVLLMIGMAVESGHLSQWNKPRPSCHVIGPGLFAAAGIFGLTSVFLGVALYVIALRTHGLHQENIGPRAPQTVHQHHLPPSAPQEPHAMRAYQSEPRQEESSLDKTSTSA